MIAICGPTGAGKSALAIALAADFRGEIVNCDSLQLYRGFDIGTAKLSARESAGVPQHMVDILAPADVYSAGEYAQAARKIIAEITARGNLPIVCGGTGFYLRALLEGLPPLPRRDESLRARLATREEAKPGRLHRLLSRLDPAAAAVIHPRDTQKLIRAVEVRLLTRSPRPPGAVAEPLRGYTILKLGLNPDRQSLYQILDARAREMFRRGLIEEVRGLLAGGCTGDEKPFEALGYRQALAVLRDTMTVEDAVASTALGTRQYAKRQWTWFRRDTQIHWLAGFGDSPEILAAARQLINIRSRP